MLVAAVACHKVLEWCRQQQRALLLFYAHNHHPVCLSFKSTKRKFQVDYIKQTGNVFEMIYAFAAKKMVHQ